MKPIAVTGPTGYIGGRLVARLLAMGRRVRCLVREPRKLQGRAFWHHELLEVVACDLEDEEATARALAGCGAAYWLVHSMLAAGATYADTDLRLARCFSRAAARASVDRLVYLGGLGETGEQLSEHLRSRRDVERALAESGVALTVFRAAMIIGAGSASFEILRYLVERLPVMVTPRWVQTRCQPIAIDDVLHYLTGCLDQPATVGRTLDIGGPEVVTYEQLIHTLAELRGLRKRWIVPVPVLTPRLSSLWIHLVTPISSRIARPLAEGLRNEVVCRDDLAARWMPGRLSTVREAIAAAQHCLDAHRIETRWSDAGVVPGDPDWAGGTVFTDPRSVRIAAPAAAVWRAVCRIGGENGWYGANWLWRVRGWMDRLVGGPGLRRGRRDPEHLEFGEALDFWRVTGFDDGRRLELRAEMRLPGVATLTFEVEPDSGAAASCTLKQTARFKPRGLFGLIYWYSVLPLHGIVFRSMLRGIERAALGSLAHERAPGGAMGETAHPPQRS